MSNDNGTTQFTESPASWNTRYITPDGFTCQLTLRAETGKELLERANSAISLSERTRMHSILWILKG